MPLEVNKSVLVCRSNINVYCNNDDQEMNAIPGHDCPRMILPGMPDTAHHSGTVRAFRDKWLPYWSQTPVEHVLDLPDVDVSSAV